MVSSDSQTVDEYIAALPEDRQATVAGMRSLILEHLPPGYEEGIQYGMIGYYIPLSRYPSTYNKQPLAYINLASQKNYVSLYLYCVYADPETEERFSREWLASGNKLNMGKSCVRFKSLDAVPMDVVARTVASTGVDEFIEMYERSRR